MGRNVKGLLGILFGLTLLLGAAFGMVAFPALAMDATIEAQSDASTATSLRMEDAQLKKGDAAWTKSDGASCYVLETGSYRLDSDLELKAEILIDGNSAVVLDLNGHGIYVASGTDAPVIEVKGACTLKDSVPSGMGGSYRPNGVSGGYLLSAVPSMPGVYVSGSFTMNGGTITGNGRGVIVADVSASGASSLFAMNGGTIKGNSDGGVLVQTTSSFILNGGTISGHLDSPGVENFGSFVMNDGAIYENKGSVASGVSSVAGGVNNYTSFTMNGGTIRNNEGFEGGGVHNAGNFIMRGGSITGNKAKVTNDPEPGESGRGGGVFVDVNGSFEMMGGGISENLSEAPVGGGVYVSVPASKPVNISGGSVIAGNSYMTANGFVASNLCVPAVTGGQAAGAPVTIVGTLTSDARIGVTMTVAGSVFTSGWARHMTSGGVVADPSDYFFSDDVSHSVDKDSQNEAMLVDGHVHGKGDSAIIFEPWTDALAAQQHGNNSNYTASNSLPTTSGSYVLTNDVQLNTCWQVPGGDVNLCLNGHSVEQSAWQEGAYLIEVGVSSTLALYDDALLGGGGICLRNATGSALHVNGGTVWLYGGSFSAPQVSASGQVVRVDSGELHIEGGSIGGSAHGTNASAATGVRVTGGSVTMNGGEISKASYGVWVDGGTFTLAGGTVSDNTSGGVQVDSKGTFNLRGGSIVGNAPYGVLVLKGNANQNPLPPNGILNLSGAPSISGNVYGGIYLQDTCVINVTGKLSLPAGATAPQIDVAMAAPGPFTTGWTTKMGANADPAQYFTSSAINYVVARTTDGMEARLAWPVASVAVADIAAPVATEALDAEATTSTANVVLGSSGAVVWSPAASDGKASYSTAYKATVTATAAEVYAFTNETTATVNGGAAKVMLNSDGTLSISYTFPRTSSAPSRPSPKADKSKLRDELAKAAELDPTAYTEASAAALGEAVTEAQAVYDNPKATQPQVNAALQALQDAEASLVPAADKAALQQEAAKAEAIDRSAYSDESLALLDRALADAKAVLADPNATQAQVDDARGTLRGAEDALEPKPAPQPVEPDGWRQAEDGSWSYLRDGARVTGWMLDEAGDWYHFGADGVMDAGWFQDADGSWYCLSAEHDGRFGHLVSGWVWDRGFWYYLSEAHDGSFGRMLTGWQHIDGAWYYLCEHVGDPLGSCALDTVTPDGYRVDVSGRWVA